MEYRTVGRSGLTASVVGLGSDNFGTKIDAQQSRLVIEAALESGITFFDTSDSYGESEVLLGKALAGHRDDVVIATKFGSKIEIEQLGAHWGRKGSRRYVLKAVESSLTRLQTDHVDLYQMHFPDPGTPIEETLATLDDLVHQGKVRYLGCSNFSAWQLAQAAHVARERGYQAFVSAQNFYNVLNRDADDELIPACADYGVGLLPFFPLAHGLLTGKYRRSQPAPSGSRLSGSAGGRYLTDERFDRLELLEEFARERDCSLLEVAIGGLVGQKIVSSVIAGATTPAQVRANVAAADWTPTPDDLRRLAEIGSSRLADSKGEYAAALAAGYDIFAADRPRSP